MLYIRMFALVLGALAFAGCSQPTIPDPEPMESAAGGGADRGAMDDRGFGDPEPVDYDPSAGELRSVIYFDFDSSEVRSDDTDVITRHAMQLASNPRVRVRLEGHADERGSREYNIGLGERRSQSVRRLLLIQGASPAQISTVSFGEERPEVDGSDEAAYSLNRRVEIKYTD